MEVGSFDVKLWQELSAEVGNWSPAEHSAEQEVGQSLALDQRCGAVRERGWGNCDEGKYSRLGLSSETGARVWESKWCWGGWMARKETGNGSMKKVTLREWVKLWKWEMEMNWEHPETRDFSKQQEGGLGREGAVRETIPPFLWFCRLDILPFVLATLPTGCLLSVLP